MSFFVIHFLIIMMSCFEWTLSMEWWVWNGRRWLACSLTNGWNKWRKAEIWEFLGMDRIRGWRENPTWNYSIFSTYKLFCTRATRRRSTSNPAVQCTVPTVAERIPGSGRMYILSQYCNEHQRLLRWPNDSNDVETTCSSTRPLFGSKIHYHAIVQYHQEIYH